MIYMNLLRKTLILGLLTLSITVSHAQTGSNTSETGRNLLLQAVQYCGSAEAFKSLKALQVQATSKLHQAATPIEVKTDRIYVFPTKVITKIFVTGQQAAEIINGDKAFHVLNGVRLELSKAETRRMRMLQWAELPFLLSQANDPTLKVDFAGTSTVEDRAVNVVLILPPGEKEVVQLYLDAESGKPITLIFVDQGNPQNPVGYWTYRDWKKVGNFQFPHKMTLYANDKTVQETQWDAVSLNPDVEENIFLGQLDE